LPIGRESKTENRKVKFETREPAAEFRVSILERGGLAFTQQIV
jgi:hypothetical protein